MSRPQTTVAALSIALGLAHSAAAWEAVWQTTLGGPQDSGASAVALTPSGGVVTAGNISQGGVSAFGVALLDGASGDEVWRFVGEEGSVWDLSLVGSEIVAVGNVERELIPGFSARHGLAATLSDGGTLLWQHAERISDVAGDLLWAGDAGPGPGGALPDVVVAGQVTGSGTNATKQFYVDLRRGSLAWQAFLFAFSDPPYDGPGAARDVALHPSGDVIAVGEMQEITAGPYGGSVGGRHLAAVRLARETGAVVWQTVLGEYSAAYALAFDAAGDVVVAGRVSEAGATGAPDFQATDLLVAKFAATDGSELWRTTIDSGIAGIRDVATTVTVDEAGDVLAGGHLQTVVIDPFWDAVVGSGVREFAVVKLAGSTGAEQWRRLVPNTIASVGNIIAPGVRGAAQSLAVDTDGSVIGVGILDGDPVGAGPTGSYGTFYVTRLDGGTGDVEWQQPLLQGYATAVAVDAYLSIVAAGLGYHDDPDGDNDRYDMVVVKFSDLLAGAAMDLFDPGDPSARRLTLSSKDALLNPPRAGSPADPSLSGARLVVRDLTSGAETIYDLPASYWRVAGRGYKYVDVLRAAGPCGKVKMKHGRLKVKCKGAGVDTSPAHGGGSQIAFRLELGPPQAARYCLEFGGTVLVDDPGRFKALESPAPATCAGS